MKDNSEVTFTVTISKERFIKLKRLAHAQNISDTSALEKAIETEFYFQNKILEGYRILIQSLTDKSSIKQVLFK